MVSKLPDEERRKRVCKAMQMHRDGVEWRIIRKRAQVEVGTAYQWAQELGMPWTGKPMAQKTAKA